MNCKTSKGVLLTVLSCALLVELLSGCATFDTYHRVPLSTAETAWLKPKIEAALSRQNCIEYMYVFGSGSRKRLAIVIEAKPLLINEHEPDAARLRQIAAVNAEAEADCLKAVKALSRDPAFPAVCEVFVSSQRFIAEPFAVSVSGTKTVNGSQTQFFGVTSCSYMFASGIQHCGLQPPDIRELLFACRITRDALVAGDAPVVTHRNGVRADGLRKGFYMRYRSPTFLAPDP